MWVVTINDLVKNLNDFISIHTTRVGGDSLIGVFQHSLQISIHTTRVGGDLSYVTFI